MISGKLLDLFKKYIELDTSLENGENYNAAAKLLESFLKETGFETQLVNIPENVAKNKNRVNLIARRFISTSLPTILFYNHMDVVPADYPDAFKFKQEDNKFFGRGTSDHKGSTVGVLSALDELASRPLKYNLIFIATTDEETDQIAQLDYLYNILKLPENTIVFDSDTEAGGISNGNLGLYQFQILIKGKSVHSAISHIGVNAVEQSSEVINFLLGVKKEYEATISKYKTFKEFGLEFVCNRCNVNMISGGVATNVVPDKCTLTVDNRYIPEKDVRVESNLLKERIIKFCREKKIEMEIINELLIEGFVTTHPLVVKFGSLYHEICNEDGESYCVMGSTQMAEWCKKHHLPHFGLGVIRPDSNIHGVGENCNLKDIENLSLTLQRFLEE